MADEREVSYEMVQGGIVVAEVTAASEADAFREIMRYAMMYCPDGPVIVRPSPPGIEKERENG